MNETINNNTKHVVEITIRMAALFLLFYSCFEIIAPFIMPVLWAIIISVSLFPLHKRLQKALGGRKSLVPILVIFIGVTGGFLLSGFIGLFSGPIILSVGYKLFIAWMKDEEKVDKPEKAI
jgi:predicted PurR-regulated permease PerM